MTGRIKLNAKIINWLLCIQCSKCSEIKDYTHFYKTNKSSLWYRWVCKECCQKYREDNRERRHNIWKKYYEEHKEKRKEYNRQYRIKNKDRLKEYDKKKRAKMWYVSIHNKTRNFVKENNLQLNECCICGSYRKIELHHPNYNKRYEVVVVCNWCHKEIHSWYRPCPNVINLLTFNQQ
jgi:hypothetical protein